VGSNIFGYNWVKYFYKYKTTDRISIEISTYNLNEMIVHYKIKVDTKLIKNE
jgi:hypothetical protein